MKIKRIIVKPKQYNFIKPVFTSQGKLERREIISVKFLNEKGDCGTGGAYPLPPFTEDVKSIIGEARSRAAQLEETNFDSFEEFSDFLLSLNKIHPTLLFAFESAFINLMIEADEITESQFIKRIRSAPIKLNALISEEDTSKFFQSAEEAVQRGFNTLKIKLGFSAFENELIRIGFLNNLSDDIKLRLDINGAWNFEVAQKKIERLTQFNVEYVEDPTNSFEDNLKLAKLFPGNVAFDQTAKGIKEIKLIAENKSVLILKPAFFGSLRRSLEVIDLFNEKGAKLIISSAFEDATGREINYALASLLSPEITHGLNTQNVLIEDSAEPYEKNGNRILFSKEIFLRKGKCEEAGGKRET